MTNQLSLRKVMTFLQGRPGYTVFVLMVAVPLSALLTVRPVLQWVAGRVGDVLLGGFSILATVWIGEILWGWWVRRAELTKIEHRLVLGMVTALSTVVLGMVNFAIHLVDPQAFLLEDAEIESFVKERRLDIERDLARHQTDAEWFQSVAARLETMQTEFLVLEKKSFWESLSSTAHEIATPDPALRITMVYSPPNRYAPPRWTLKIAEDDHQLVRHVNAPNRDKGLAVAAVIELLDREREAEEAVVATLASRRNSRKLPAYAFVYQWGMTLLGDNPGYVKPNSNLTRGLAMCFSFLKYLYVAVFIAMFVEEAQDVRRATAQAVPPPEPSRAPSGEE